MCSHGIATCPIKERCGLHLEGRNRTVRLPVSEWQAFAAENTLESTDLTAMMDGVPGHNRSQK